MFSGILHLRATLNSSEVARFRGNPDQPQANSSDAQTTTTDCQGLSSQAPFEIANPRRSPEVDKGNQLTGNGAHRSVDKTWCYRRCCAAGFGGLERMRHPRGNENSGSAASERESVAPILASSARPNPTRNCPPPPNRTESLLPQLHDGSLWGWLPTHTHKVALHPSQEGAHAFKASPATSHSAREWELVRQLTELRRDGFTCPGGRQHGLGGGSVVNAWAAQGALCLDGPTCFGQRLVQESCACALGPRQASVYVAAQLRLSQSLAPQGVRSHVSV